MIEQWYAVHKTTGEFFCHKGRYCFSEKGILQSIRNDVKWSVYSYTKGWVQGPPDSVDNWEIRKVKLT
jgi:hypothetical protein